MKKSIDLLFVAKPPLINKMAINMDSNYWGLIVVPLGLVICFWPALLAAALTKPEQQPSTEKVKKK